MSIGANSSEEFLKGLQDKNRKLGNLFDWQTS